MGGVRYCWLAWRVGSRARATRPAKGGGGAAAAHIAMCGAVWFAWPARSPSTAPASSKQQPAVTCVARRGRVPKGQQQQQQQQQSQPGSRQQSHPATNPYILYRWCALLLVCFAGRVARARDPTRKKGEGQHVGSRVFLFQSVAGTPRPASGKNNSSTEPYRIFC